MDVKFINPPILQLVLTASFAPPLNGLSIIDLADLYGMFRADFPIFRQIARADPMSFQPHEVNLATPGMPRIAFASADTSLQIAFQEDRMTTIWNRSVGLGESPAYPGFDAVLELLCASLEKLRFWIAGRGLDDIVPAVGEIVYNDAFSLKSADGTDIPMAKIVRVANPDVVFPIHVAEYKWAEPLDADIGGFANVEISAPARMADNSLVLNFETTIAFDPGPDWVSARSRFETGHRAALQIFDRVINHDVIATSV